MKHDPMDYIMGRLRAGGYDPRAAGPNQWKSRCPGHNGKRHNLSIKRGDDGTPLLKCHHIDENGRNCSWHDILRGIGISASELHGRNSDEGRRHRPFPSEKTGGPADGTNGRVAPGGKRRYAYPNDAALLKRLAAKTGGVTAQWSYTDAAGAEVFRIVRLDTVQGKTFRPIHRTGAGWVVGDPPGLRPLYRLPELGDASRVFVTEGEKAAEAVRQLGGLVATTSAHGAQSPRWTDWGPLAGKEVIILPDHDAPGAGYSKLVVAQMALLSPCPSVRVVPLELIWKTDAVIHDGDDVVDWLSAGVPPDWTPAQCAAELDRAAAAAIPVEFATATNGSEGCLSTAKSDRGNNEPRAAGPHPHRGRDREEPRETTFDALMRLAKAARLSRTSDGRCYAEMQVGDHRQAHNIRSREFRHWLTLSCYKERGHAPGQDVVKSVTDLLEAIAASDGTKEDAHLRVAAGKDGSACYLDLGDPTRRAVEIDATGWRLVDQPDLLFRRPRGMLPLPAPIRGGCIDLLKKYINIDEQDFPLLVGVLTLCLRPIGPYPITIVSGEQGSAKSTLGQLAKFLIDPNAIPLRPEPKDGRDLMIGAFNSWLLSFDNISSMTNALSDDFCRLATRGSHATRQLYADDEESIIAATRPVIINGIDEFAWRSDFLDRAVSFHLPAIDDAERCYEEEFWKSVEAERPLILGVLLDGLAGMMRLLSEVHLERRPRMADAARAGEAACRAHGWAPGTFVSLYEKNRRATNDWALESSPVARAIMRLMSGRESWTGTPSELLEELTAIVGEKTAATKGWPKSARWLSTALRRTSPQLRMVGITVDSDRLHERIVTINAGPKL